jgi:hypothetical protein
MSAKQLVLPGTPVVKSALALPATATATLFTVAGGNVMITGLFGRVTTAFGATVTTVSLGTGLGGNAVLATATTVTSKAAGSWLGLTQSAGAVTTLANPTGPLFFNGNMNAQFLPATGVLVAGPDTITWTTSATDTGNITWYLWYVPLDFDAQVS